MKTSILEGITYVVHQGKVRNDKKTTEENNVGTPQEFSNQMEREDMKLFCSSIGLYFTNYDCPIQAS